MFRPLFWAIIRSHVRIFRKLYNVRHKISYVSPKFNEISSFSFSNNYRVRQKANKFKNKEDTANVFLFLESTQNAVLHQRVLNKTTQVAALNIDTLM